MPTYEPWHSLAENVHHAHTDCVAAARAAAVPGVVRGGPGGRVLCEVCAELIRKDRDSDAAGLARRSAG
jgi:hypothetical protein